MKRLFVNAFVRESTKWFQRGGEAGPAATR